MAHAILTLARYPSRHVVTALHSMAFFRFPLSRNRKISFFRLLGCGRNGSFDLHPDWRQYGIFSVSDSSATASLHTNGYDHWKKDYYGSFIDKWWSFGGAETWTIVLEPVLSHGSWGGKQPFQGPFAADTGGPIAVLTRASIRPGKARDFWRNVPAVQQTMADAEGLLFSVGIGEAPLLKQATLSVWESSEQMKAFAYRMQEHREVIRRTRDRQWYSEEMFSRFRPLACAGTLQGRQPVPTHLLPGLRHL